MADNYLENRYNEVFNSGKTRVKHVGHTLDDLLTRNRSCRGFNRNYQVSEETLRNIVAVCSKVPSARNQQVLRFRTLTGADADAMLPLVRMGAALPEWHLPLAGTEPNAYIVVMSTTAENRMVDIDLGIAAQSMLLRATEIGLNGLIIEAFNPSDVQAHFQLPYAPIMVIAIGKSAETFRLQPVDAGSDLRYYREEGVHIVPKIKQDQLLV
ncbi:MAG: nitroreductase family protein [Bacteroidales bacterium]|nr:nitroreductase family protein [Bacteroidales bacterium]